MDTSKQASNNSNQLRFDMRLQSKSGKDVHREFKGTFFLNDETLAIAEVKLLRCDLINQL
jgi:hypothetical protein